jgi:hypothetical protein
MNPTMPLKHLVIEFVGLSIYATVAAIVSMMTFVGYQEAMTVPGVTEAGMTQQTQIFLDSVLRAWCLAGSVGGAGLSCLLYRFNTEDTHALIRLVAARFVASAIVGVSGTPLVARYMGWELTVDNVLAASTATAFLGVSFLEAVTPAFNSQIVERFHSWIGRKE